MRQLVINSNWHPNSYRFGVIAAYCSIFGHFAFLSPPLGGIGTTYDVHLGLIGKRVVDFLLVIIELFSLDVKELPIDSALGVLATINIARTHSVSTGDNGDFEITLQIFYFSHDRLKILHTGRERQYAKSCRTELWISSPKKLTPL